MQCQHKSLTHQPKQSINFLNEEIQFKMIHATNCIAVFFKLVTAFLEHSSIIHSMQFIVPIGPLDKISQISCFFWFAFSTTNNGIFHRKVFIHLSMVSSITTFSESWPWGLDWSMVSLSCLAGVVPFSSSLLSWEIGEVPHQFHFCWCCPQWFFQDDVVVSNSFIGPLVGDLFLGSNTDDNLGELGACQSCCLITQLLNPHF